MGIPRHSLPAPPADTARIRAAAEAAEVNARRTVTGTEATVLFRAAADAALVAANLLLDGPSDDTARIYAHAARMLTQRAFEAVAA